MRMLVIREIRYSLELFLAYSVCIVAWIWLQVSEMKGQDMFCITLDML